MQSNAQTVEQYLAELPADRRVAIEAVRRTILANKDSDVEEGIQYGMIAYFVPPRVFPAGYHGDPKLPLPFAGLASRKQHMSLHMMACYGGTLEEKWLRERWTRTGRKLDMGKACIRFRSLDDVPLEVVAEAFRRVSAASYITQYESAIARERKPAARPAAKNGRTAKAARRTSAANGAARRRSRAK